MKKIILILVLLMPMLAWAGKDRGGGDPLLINAVIYPNKVQLTAAIAIAKANVQATYPELSQEFNSEADSVLDKEYFLMLPSLVVLKDSDIEGYNDLEDVHSFYELGGYTKHEKGAPIYFSERVRQYSQEQLASNVVHEVFHHILDETMNEERFVRELTEAVASRNSNIYLDRSLSSGVVVRPGYISGAGFYKQLLEQFVNILSNKGRISDRRFINELEAMKFLATKKNVYDFDLYRYYGWIYESVFSDFNWPEYYGMKSITALIRLVNPNSRYLIQDEDYFYYEACRKYKNRWFSTKCLDPAKLGELMVP